MQFLPLSKTLLLRLCLPSTLIRQENEDFRKHSSNRRNLKTLGFRLREDVKHFEHEAFQKNMALRLKCDFPDEVFLKHKSKVSGDYCVFKVFRRSVIRKKLMHSVNRGAYINTVVHCHIMFTAPKGLGIPVVSVV